MRKAILEGLEVEFAMPPLPLVAGVVGGALGGWSRGRGRGARLEIAGVVVGQWGGGSYPQRTQRYPQVLKDCPLPVSSFSVNYEGGLIFFKQNFLDCLTFSKKNKRLLCLC